MIAISVVIPVFNAAPFVEEAVASCLAQPEVTEILLVDDGSTDGSPAVCATLAARDRRVRLLAHPGGGNRGAAAARNAGAAAARGDALAFLDADDWYQPARFRESARLLASRDDVDGVYEAVGISFEQEDARREWFRRNDFEITMLQEPSTPDAVFEALIAGTRGYIHLDGLLLRRRVWDRLGGFNERIRLVEDTEFCLRLAACARLVPGRADEPVAVRRLHGGNSILGPLWQGRRPQIVAMWRDLLRWALARPLCASRLDALCEAYLAAAARGAGDNRLSARAALRLRSLLEVAWLRPAAIRHAYFWRHTVRAFDVTKLRYLITGVPAS